MHPFMMETLAQQRLRTLRPGQLPGLPEHLRDDVWAAWAVQYRGPGVVHRWFGRRFEAVKSFAALRYWRSATVSRAAVNSPPTPMPSVQAVRPVSGAGALPTGRSPAVIGALPTGRGPAVIGCRA